MAFRRNYNQWKTRYKSAYQSSGGWNSQCIFIPADILINAIKETFYIKIAS
jgi:hypothetical protein